MKINCSYNLGLACKTNNVKQINPSYNNQPAFTGIWSFLAKGMKDSEQVYLDKNMAILSPKQVEKAKEYVAQEVHTLIKSSFTPEASKRLDNLLNSPYIDYTLPVCGDCNLRLFDFVDVAKTSTEKYELYNQFLRTSLGKTMPMELVNQVSKDHLYVLNNGIFHIFQDYTKADELSKESQEVRDMVIRMSKAGIKNEGVPSFFADCLITGKTQMCKILQENFDINPETQVDILRCKNHMLEKLSSSFGVTNKVEDPHYVRETGFDINTKNLLVVYPYKFKEMREPSWAKKYTEDKISLYDIAALCSHENSQKFFDIPSYLSEYLAGKFRYNHHLNLDLIKEFFNRNVTKHPELYSFEFFEKFATRLKATKSLDFQSYFDSIPKYCFNKIDVSDAKKLIEQLKADGSKESLKRLETVSEVYNYIFG